MKYKKGAYDPKRIERLYDLLRIGCPEGETVLLSEIVPTLPHHYKNDRSAIESFKRYLKQNKFPDFRYNYMGTITRVGSKKCRGCYGQKKIWLDGPDGTCYLGNCPDCQGAGRVPKGKKR